MQFAVVLVLVAFLFLALLLCDLDAYNVYHSAPLQSILL